MNAMNSTTKTISTLIGSVLAVFTMMGCATSTSDEGASQSAAFASDYDLPTIPPVIAVPTGNKIDFTRDAIGVQIYTCQVAGSGYAWVFQAPQANLFNEKEIVGTHFAGPTWKSKDGSSVVGAKLASVTVNPQSIPWLLLKAASHAGNGSMSDVTFIQRLETVGGLAPATGCDAAHVGAISNVNYTATYAFYRAD